MFRGRVGGQEGGDEELRGERGEVEEGCCCCCCCCAGGVVCVFCFCCCCMREVRELGYGGAADYVFFQCVFRLEQVSVAEQEFREFPHGVGAREDGCGECGPEPGAEGDEGRVSGCAGGAEQGIVR